MPSRALDLNQSLRRVANSWILPASRGLPRPNRQQPPRTLSRDKLFDRIGSQCKHPLARMAHSLHEAAWAVLAPKGLERTNGWLGCFNFGLEWGGPFRFFVGRTDNSC